MRFFDRFGPSGTANRSMPHGVSAEDLIVTLPSSSVSVTTQPRTAVQNSASRRGSTQSMHHAVIRLATMISR